MTTQAVWSVIVVYILDYYLIIARLFVCVCLCVCLRTELRPTPRHQRTEIQGQCWKEATSIASVPLAPVRANSKGHVGLEGS